MLVYFNGRIMHKDEVRISPDDRGFVFGDGVYEVILAYKGRLFKAGAHFERLCRSLGELRIKEPDMTVLRNVSEKLIHENGLDSGQATVYIQITRGEAPRKHVFPSGDVPLTVYASAAAFDSPEKEWTEGVNVISVPDTRWLRCDIKTTSLVPNVLACQQAKEQGAREAVFVRDGAVTEGSHTTFCAVFDGTLVTYPESRYILPGITRQTVLDLCRDLAIPVRLRPILTEELADSQECMLLGTTTEVMPVIQIDERMVGQGKPGPITRRLQQSLREMIRGG
ncbi:MAG: D-amino-acid transaminase [Desulfococcaceae bacterium]